MKQSNPTLDIFSHTEGQPLQEITSILNADPVAHSPAGFLSSKWGFVPAMPPIQSLPSSHSAWDEAARCLPEFFSQRRMNQLADLPILDAGTQNLADDYLWRASTLLGMMAHSYVRANEGLFRTHPQAKPVQFMLPDAIYHPWKQVAERLGRPTPALTYSDTILYNWQFKAGKTNADERIVENLDLLCPAFGSQEEKVFYLTMLEMHTRSTSLIDLVVGAQKAVIEDHPDLLAEQLIKMIEVLRTMTFDSLMKIDPNPYSDTFTDPLIWAKTVAPFAAPTRSDELGLSGGGAPVFHLLDAFFERKKFNSQIGHEVAELTKWTPLFHRKFISQVASVSAYDYIQRKGLSELSGIYASATDAYCGKRGWLGMHRLKVYGFMELGFKIGRTQTNGGFSGEVADRAWEALDDSLEEARKERLEQKEFQCPFSRRKKITSTSDENDRLPIKRITLDIENKGLVYEVGDRLGILAPNSHELVVKTLKALEASGNERLKIGAVWKTFLQENFPDLAQAGEIPLYKFLQCAKIRPLITPVAQVLHNLSHCRRLKEIIETKSEDQFELWDALEMMRVENFDVKRLWQAEAWEEDSLNQIVPPEAYRIYSISSAPDFVGKTDLDLTIGGLTYLSPQNDKEHTNSRRGLASQFLNDEWTDRVDFPVRVVRPSRFHLPKDHTRPVVMFAGGTGISPFRGFLQKRCNTQGAGPNWLFMGVRTPEELPYRQELELWAKKRLLQLHVAFSRAPFQYKVLPNTKGETEVQLVEGKTGYVDMLFDDPTIRRHLVSMLMNEEDGGRSGYFYICGQSKFAHTVVEGLKRILAQELDTVPDDESVTVYIRKLVAEGRLLQDVFTTFAPANSANVRAYKEYNISDVITKNNDSEGYWFIVNGFVYDVTDFLHLHPGGDQILRASAGMDATRSYEKVEHQLNPEVHALLDMYKIGILKRLDFGKVWGIALKTRASQHEVGVFYLTLGEAFNYWLRYLYAVVETENTLKNNYHLLSRPLIRNEAPGMLTKLKAEFILETHYLFSENQLSFLLGDDLKMLWNIFIGFCAQDERSERLTEDLDKITTGLQASVMKNGLSRANHLLNTVSPVYDENDAGWLELSAWLNLFINSDLDLIFQIKMSLRYGTVLFEDFQSKAIETGRRQIINTLLKISYLMQDYYQKFSNQANAITSGAVVSEDKGRGITKK